MTRRRRDERAAGRELRDLKRSPEAVARRLRMVAAAACPVPHRWEFPVAWRRWLLRLPGHLEETTSIG